MPSQMDSPKPVELHSSFSAAGLDSAPGGFRPLLHLRGDLRQGLADALGCLLHALDDLPRPFGHGVGRGPRLGAREADASGEGEEDQRLIRLHAPSRPGRA